MMLPGNYRNIPIMNEKEKILEHISGKGPGSPAEIAGGLGIGEERVRSHVLEMKDMGYGIDILNDRVFLSREEDLLLPSLLRDGLNTDIFGKREIHYFTETDSTNTRGEELAAAGSPEGTLVIAEKQTAGRGRSGRSWYSGSRGGIYISLILRPELTPAQVQGITLMTAVAASEALMNICALPLLIKWPNDILINGKKAAGILTTMETRGSEVTHIVVGIGINVNTETGSMPGEIRDIATSLSHESGRKLYRVEVLRGFLESFEKKYRLFRDGRFPVILDEWIKYSGLSGKNVEIIMKGKTIEGTVTGIDNNGYLQIRSGTGIQYEVISGEIIKIK